MTPEELYAEYLRLYYENQYLEKEVENLKKERDVWKEYSVKVKDSVEKYLKGSL